MFNVDKFLQQGRILVVLCKPTIKPLLIDDINSGFFVLGIMITVLNKWIGRCNFYRVIRSDLLV